MKNSAGTALGTVGMRKPGYFQVGGKGPDRNAGFTLIELLVVIGIVSLLAGLRASAFFEAQRNYGLAAAAGELQSIFRRARNQSINNGPGSFVVVEPPEREVEEERREAQRQQSLVELLPV